MSASHFQLPYWVWDVYVLVICAAALRVGGRSERVGAVAILTGWIATVIAVRSGWGQAANAVVGVDTAVLVVFVILALRSHRYWPIFAAGFQLLSILTHWAHSLDRTLGAWAYLTASIIWGYLLVGALAAGTWSAWRERTYAADVDGPADAGATRR